MTEEIVSYGVLSLIPAILAVVLAFWTKNVIISLMASLFVGCLITAGWNPWNAMQVMFSDHLFVDMTGSSNAQTIIMMSFVGGFVALIEATGGAKAFAAAIANKVHRRSTAQTTAWLGGLAIFFRQQPDPGAHLPPHLRPAADFPCQAGLHSGLHLLPGVHPGPHYRLGRVHHGHHRHGV